MFGKIGQRTSLNLSPLFDHAVIVQKSPGRYLYVVGRGHSHQEADQVISIISLIPHSGTDLEKPRHICCFSRALSFENQQNCWSDTVMRLGSVAMLVINVTIVVYCFVFLFFILQCSCIVLYLSICRFFKWLKTIGCWI